MIYNSGSTHPRDAPIIGIQRGHAHACGTEPIHVAREGLSLIVCWGTGLCLRFIGSVSLHVPGYVVGRYHLVFTLCGSLVKKLENPDVAGQFQTFVIISTSVYCTALRGG